MNENTVWALLSGYEIKIKDVYGNELINTNKAVDALPPLMKRRIIAVSGFQTEEKTHSQREFSNYPLFLEGRDIGALEIRPLIFQEGQEKETVFKMRSNRFFLLSILLLGGISLLLSLIFSRKLTDPIKKLTAAAKGISEGNVKSRVTVKGKDEMSDLAKTFNAMAENLEVHESLRRKLTSNIAHELGPPLPQCVERSKECLTG